MEHQSWKNWIKLWCPKSQEQALDINKFSTRRSILAPSDWQSMLTKQKKAWEWPERRDLREEPEPEGWRKIESSRQLMTVTDGHTNIASPWASDRANYCILFTRLNNTPWKLYIYKNVIVKSLLYLT